jgi:large subunit ribosomal protein L21
MSIYAVVKTGGKQYRVQPGDVVQIEKLEGEVGSSLKFDQVLMVAKPSTESSQIWLGKPLLSGANVDAEIVGQGRGDKILIIKMKRRKQYRRTQGHRQFYTQVLITGVSNGGSETATLSASDKQARLAKFQSQLTPKGEAHTPKTMGSRKRLAAAAQLASGSAPKAAAPKSGSATKAAPAAAKAKKAPSKKKAD